MNHDRETRAVRRWLPVAAAATVALVAALWAGLGRDTSVAHTPERDAGEATVALPAASEAATSATPTSLDAPSPTSLSSGRGSLTISVEADGLVAAQPYLRVTRHPGGETEARALGERLTTAWPLMPAGRYTIEMLDDTWIVDEPDITLAAGEIRTITLSSRRTAAVRVAGAFSGQLTPATSVRVQALARVDDSTIQREVEMTSDDVPTDGRFVLFGLPATLADGSVVEKLRVSARVGRETATSDWFTPESLATSPTVLVRVPEPVLVGRITREAAGDGLDVHNALQPSVWLEAEDAPPPPAPSPHLTGVHTPTMVLGTGRNFARVERDGRFELRLAELPAGPVRVRAGNSIDQPAEAGPFTLSAKSLPLQVDLVLAASGSVRGSVRVRVGSAGDKRIAQFTLGTITARRAEDGRLQSNYRYVGTKVTGNEALLSFLVGSLEPGEYDVAVDLLPANDLDEPPDARQLVQRVQVQTGRPATLEFDALAPSGLATVRGSVALPPGLRADEVRITLARAVAPLAQRAVALDASGRFAFADVAPGDWVVRAARAGRTLSSFFGGDDSSSVVPGGRLAVHVEHGDVLLPALDLSRPEVRLHSPNARHLFISGADSEIYHCTVDESGLGRLYGLPAGRYSVYAGKGEKEDLVAFEVGAGDAVVTVEVP